MPKSPKSPQPLTAPKGFTKTTINLPTPVHRALKKIAKEEDRSVSGQASVLIKAGIETLQEAKP